MAKPKRYGTRKSKRRITKRHHRKTIRARGGGFLNRFRANKQKKLNEELYIAAKHNWLEVVRQLLEKGANPNDEFETPEDPVVSALFTRRRRNVRNYIGKAPTTALLHAITIPNADMVAILLDKGADPNFPEHNKPLPYANAKAEYIAVTSHERGKKTLQDIINSLVNKGATL
jgi:ankyrin repeat protein